MSKSNIFSIKNICCLILAVGSVIVFFWLLLRPSDNLKQLRADLDERGVITKAVIYDKKPVIKSNVLFFYEFKIDSINYNGNFSGYLSWKLDVGDSIQIRYDPLNPVRNERVNVPVEKEKKSPLFWIIVLPLTVAVIYFSFRWD
ncbi:MAG: hypothetical protein HDT06_03365 [Bacteroidales bacterium]|nr:hypothetical protein [Bacteroidales bacterium]